MGTVGALCSVDEGSIPADGPIGAVLFLLLHSWCNKKLVYA